MIVFRALVTRFLFVIAAAVGAPAMTHATAPPPLQASASQKNLESPGQAMPDEGPAQEGPLGGPEGLVWQEGLAAYKKGAWIEAGRLFETILTGHQASPLVPSAQAFLIEISLRDSPRRNLAAAIQAYKTLLRDYPHSQNARRAEWRIADLYLEQGWLQEAQAAYEQALAHALDVPFDGSRALLGLGYTFMAMQKWSDAEHAFSMMRKRTDHEELSRGATIGLAHALYRQRRLPDAQALYEFGYLRWPKVFRLDPLALERFAMTQLALRRDASARELLILFYNMYPRHNFAPAALLQLGDSLLAASQPALAEFFYALTSSLYPDTVQDTTARMRIVTLRADRMLPAGQNWVGLTVSAMMHNAAIPDQQETVLPSTLQTIAARYAGDPAGTEALVHLGRYFETRSEMSRALLLYKTAVLRPRRADDPWPLKAAERLSTLLKPWLEAAVISHDDLTVVTLFHRHGPSADQLYARSPLLLEIAEAHRRLGFLLEAVRLYQPLAKSKDPAILEPALIGLGRTYLDQRDPESARKVLERYRFQFPAGRYESEVLQLLVEVMERQQDLEGLLHLCRNWLLHHQTHPDRAAMYLHLAATLGRLEKWEESAMAYTEAFKAGTGKTPDALLAYADILSRLSRHEEAIAAYRTVAEKKPSARQAEWAHLRTAKHWHALRQDDRAAAALAQVGAGDDPVLHRYASSFKGSLQAARRPTNGEGL